MEWVFIVAAFAAAGYMIWKASQKKSSGGSFRKPGNGPER